MVWYFVSSIGLLFLYIPQATVSFDMCSNIAQDFSSGSSAFDLLVEDVDTTPRNCSCEITANRDISVVVYLPCPCSQCGSDNFCPQGPCFCFNVDLTTTPTCMPKFGNPNCPGVSYNPDSCSTSKKFTLNLSTKPLSSCRAAQKTPKLEITIQLVAGHDSAKPDPVFKEVSCTVRSVTSTVTSTVTPTTESNSKPAKLIIGIVVGVGGAALITAIVIVIVVLRRRRAESNKSHDNDTSQATPAAATGETAYESYPMPVSTTIAAYDNATIGATSSDQTLTAYDNERVGESINPYAEVKEPEERGNDNGYDNSGIGRSEVYSMYKEVGKDYDNTDVKPSTNIENETTVIDNEFYE